MSMFEEIERKLRCMNSDAKISQLIDLLSSIQSLSDAKLVELVKESARQSTPRSGIYLIKFISSFSRKSSRFLKLIQEDLPGVVLFCFQVATPDDKPTIILLVEGWRMMGVVWSEIAVKSLLLINLFVSGPAIEETLQSLTNVIVDDLKSVELRTDRVISALNMLTSL